MSPACSWRCQCEQCVLALSDKAESAHSALVTRIESSLNNRQHPRWFTYGAPPFSVETVETLGGATIDYPKHFRELMVPGERENPQVNQRYRVTGTVNGETSVYEITVGRVRGQFVGMKHVHVDGVR